MLNVSKFGDYGEKSGRYYVPVLYLVCGSNIVLLMVVVIMWILCNKDGNY